MAEAVEVLSPHYLVQFQEAIDKAVLEGFTVVRGSSRIILLDIDDVKKVAEVQNGINFLKCFVEVLSVEQWQSKSGNGLHFAITTDRDMSATERLLIQCALGSDPFHELLSLTTGIWNGNDEPTMLFRPPAKAIAVDVTSNTVR